MSTQMNSSLRMTERVVPLLAGREEAHEKTAAAFGLSAAVTIVFNTLLAWVKDAYDPLNSFMASLTGHHWRTHGLVDVILFFVLGFLFMSRSNGAHITDRLIIGLAASVVVAGAGLAAWFLVT